MNNEPIDKYMRARFVLKVKNYFVSQPDNAFLQRIRAVTDIAAVTAFPKDANNFDIHISFPEKQNGLRCIYFSTVSATVWHSFNGAAVGIPFYYAYDEEPGYIMTDAMPHLMHSIYEHYAQLDPDKLLSDIARLIEALTAGRVSIDYLVTAAKRNSTTEAAMLPMINGNKKLSDKQKEETLRELETTLQRDVLTRQLVSRSRVYIDPDSPIAESWGWNDKFIEDPKLKTAKL